MSLSQMQSMQATLMNIAQVNPAKKNQAAAQEFNNQDFFNILNQTKNTQAVNQSANQVSVNNQNQSAQATTTEVQKTENTQTVAQPSSAASTKSAPQTKQEQTTTQTQVEDGAEAAQDVRLSQLNDTEARDLQEANELLSSLAGILAQNQAATVVAPVTQASADKPLEVIALGELTLETDDLLQRAARDSLENMGEQLDEQAQQNLDPEAFEQVQALKKENLSAGDLAETVKTGTAAAEEAKVLNVATNATTSAEVTKTKEDIFRQNLAPQQAAKPELSSVLEAKLQPVGDEKGVSMTAATTIATAATTTNTKLDTVMPTQQNVALPSVQTPMSSPKWSQEIAQNLMIMASRRLDMAQMAITPAHLGPINVALKLTQDQASVLFVAATPQAKEALEQNMNKLATMLAENGLQLQDAQVSSGQSQEDRQAAQQAFLMQQQQNQTAQDHGGEFAALAANMGLPGQSPADNSTQNTSSHQASRASVEDGRVSVFA